MLELIAASSSLIDSDDVIARNWLDIEDLYRAEGWVVEYDKLYYSKPYYIENHDAYFVFKKK